MNDYIQERKIYYYQNLLAISMLPFLVVILTHFKVDEKFKELTKSDNVYDDCVVIHESQIGERRCTKKQVEGENNESEQI